MVVVITEDTARKIAADWHTGQASKLYAFASSGTILPGIRAELGQAWADNNLIIKNTKEALKQADEEKYRLERLRAYINVHHPKPEVSEDE